MWDVGCEIVDLTLCPEPCALRLRPPDTSRFGACGGFWTITIFTGPDFLSGSVLARVVLTIAG
jgi:hypothetical protein